MEVKTEKQLIEEKIEELQKIEKFVSDRTKSNVFRINTHERALVLDKILERVLNLVQYIVFISEFLEWMGANMTNSEGKITLKIFKLVPLFKAAYKMVMSIIQVGKTPKPQTDKIAKAIVILLMSIPFFGYCQGSCASCGGTNKTLTVTANTGTAPFVYTWTKPNAAVVNGNSVVADQSGTYVWRVTDANNCTGSGTQTVEIEPAPTISISAVNSCVNTPQIVSATGVPPGYTYTWFLSGGTPATATTPTVSVLWSTGGFKSITLAINKTVGNQNCAFQSSTVISINAITGSVTCN